MTTSTESFKKERTILKSQLTRFNTFLTRLDEHIDIDQLKLRIQHDEPLLSKFNEVQFKVEMSSDGLEDEVEREAYENNYFSAMGVAKARLNSQLHKLSNSIDNKASTNNSPEVFSRVKLPSIQLPEFNGDYQVWSHFIDIFESLIHNNTQLSEVEKFHYLKSCLKGEAVQAISSLEINNANYNIAYVLLKQRYENKRLIKHKHIKALFELNPVKAESHSQLRKLLDQFNKNFRALTVLGLPTNSWDALMIYILSSKLDPVSRRSFEESVKDIEDPTVKQFEKFLNERCLLLETLETKTKPQSNSNENKRILTHVAQPANNLKCSFCKQPHYNFLCEKFVKLSFNDKLEEVKKLNLCKNCLRPGHIQIDCRSTRNCKFCNKRHNSLLHRHSNENPMSEHINVNPPRKQEPSNPICNLAAFNKKSSILATVQLNIMDKHGRPVLCRALLDNGSMANFMTYELYQKLNLKSFPIDQPLGGIANSHSRAERVLEARIESIDKKYISIQEFLLLDGITNNLPHTPIENIQVPDNIKLADESFNIPGKIDMLLDVGVYYDILCIGLFKSNIKGIVFQKTRLGWVVAGNLRLKLNSIQTPVCNVTSLNNLSHQLHKFWDIENEFETKNSYPIDEFCERHFLNNFKREKDGRLQVALPFKQDKPELGTTKELAIKRFLNLERRFAREPEFKQRYVKFINEYIQMNHAFRTDLVENDQEGCFLSHHGVLKEERTTTKLRVVFDASAQSTTGYSLNDTLCVGPILQRDLISIILKFRTHAFVIVGDIEKMYRQVNVRPGDHKYQKIVWRDNPENPLGCVVLKTVTYGTAPASFLAVRSLHQTAIDHQKEFPDASRAILKDFYMDDLLTGANSIENTLKLKHDITHILSQYGFPVHKWRSNFPLQLPNETGQDFIVFDGDSSKTLGLLWHSGRDCFDYSVKFHVFGKITKRSVLAAIARLFDPIGLLGPVVLEAKLVMQEIWMSKIEWDESLPMEIFTKWESFVNQFKLESVIAIPRLVTLPDYSNIQLHGFSDASEKAYGCCIYLRTINAHGEVMTRLLCSKSRVAPLKTISLPRLELCGAVLLVNLLQKVKKSLEIEFHSVHLWCDSTIVLHWIHLEPTNLKTFVANRISHIQTNANGSIWRHVPSKLNPADLISRGSKLNSLCDLWWSGPSFLERNEEEWPSNIFEINSEIDVEEKKINLVLLVVAEDFEFDIVTPTGRHCLTYDDESWKPTEDSKPSSKEGSPDDAKDNRPSKTKRVKNYLRKCKNALGNRSSTADITPVEQSTSSWYIDDELNVGEVNEIHEDFENCKSINEELEEKQRTALIVEVRAPVSKNGENGDGCFTKAESSESLRRLQNKILEKVRSPLLPELQETVEGNFEESFAEEKAVVVQNLEEEGRSVDFGNEIKIDVVGLVDKYFGNLYKNYWTTRKVLVRQARNLLVCEYDGCLQRFEEEFCSPGSVLLQYVKEQNDSSGCSPAGWPLCLGTSGVIIHLGPIDPTAVRNRDCYVCLLDRKTASGLELALTWRKFGQLESIPLAEIKGGEVKMCSKLGTAIELESYAMDQEAEGSELLQMLQNLLVTIEYVVQRVPLDELNFPCPQCSQYLPLEFSRTDDSECIACACQCTCRFVDGASKKDSGIQTSPMFEVAGSIPHIDSDEDDDKASLKSGGSSKRSMELVKPRRIADLPEKLLMSGINLPGTIDINGRPIILCYAECIARANLNKYEIAKLLLYYATVTSADRLPKGFTILLVSETEDYNKVLEVLEKATILLGNHVRIAKILIWRPGIDQDDFTSSRNQVVVLFGEASLWKHITKEQAPASCGGNCNHDQLEWVEFFKQLEPFLATCRSAARALLSTLAQLRNDDVPLQATRRFLNHQSRQIQRAIQLEVVQRLRRDGHATLTSLEERTQWLSGSMDVKRSASFAAESFSSVNRVAKRLEQLAQERKERMKEIERVRSLQKEVEEVLAWVRSVGEESLKNQAIILRAVLDVSSVKIVEKDFEKFFFNAMRHLEKGNDLIEESNSIPDAKGKPLKESANNLKVYIKNFGERLEETRENVEDCSRCFQLLESCSDILEDDNKEQEEFKRLALKSGNERLIQICENVTVCHSDAPVSPKPPDKETQELATSTPIKSQNTQIRRRSVSSLAFIYKCNHHAAGVSCNCCESDTENTVSYKLKKKYMQTLQNCPCKDTLERKNSVTLDGIKEVRESAENLLEKLDNEDRCGRCDSGVSTADNSVGDDSVYKKKLERTCSCQFYRESCALCSTNSSSTGSNQDHTEHQQDSIIEECSDGFVKSGSDDIEEEPFTEERRKVPPVPANSHLHCHSSTLHLPMDAFDQSADPKTQKTLLYIMREMIQTEQDYVRSLDYVIENYMPELLREDIPQALRGQRNVVFGNIEKIYEFHSQHFLRELEQCERHPLNVGQIFLKYDKKFYLYALYNKNKPKSDSLMSEYGSQFFKSKQIQLGDKMDLASYLLKPVQRMGKYALLLQQLMKACPELPPGASERAITEQDDLKQAEQMVRFQLRHGNDLLAMDSIRECDVNLKEQGRLMRQNEFLVWEGKTGKKSLRQVFLFEDLILFSKARRFPDRKNLDLYIYKNSMKMTDIGLTARIGESPTKFEIWFRKRKPNDTYILQSMSEDIKKAWAEELSQLLWKQAIKNREVRMAEMSSMGIGNKPCLDIRPSADQISDRSISVAQLCRTAPRFRNSVVGSGTDTCRSSKRPHSVISMSSVSTSSSGSSAASSSTAIGTNTLLTAGFDSTCPSPKAYHRSGTLNSQCSTESGIIADISLGSDDCPESQHNLHWPLEKSNSQHSSISQKSTLTQSDDTQVTNFHVPDDVTINI